MKAWFQTFSATLLAGLLLFAIYRIDVQLDRNAKEWDERADARTASLKSYVDFAKNAEVTGDAEVCKQAWDIVSHSLTTAEWLLRDIPQRSHSFSLEYQVKDAKAALAAAKHPPADKP